MSVFVRRTRSSYAARRRLVRLRSASRSAPAPSCTSAIQRRSSVLRGTSRRVHGWSRSRSRRSVPALRTCSYGRPCDRTCAGTRCEILSCAARVAAASPSFPDAASSSTFHVDRRQLDAAGSDPCLVAGRASSGTTSSSTRSTWSLASGRRRVTSPLSRRPQRRRSRSLRTRSATSPRVAGHGRQTVIGVD